MNTLAWLAATVASLWLSLFLFNDLNEAPLGFAALVLFGFCLSGLIWGATQDWSALFGKNEEDEA